MKVLQLHQPYASLIAVEVKRIETRSWSAGPSLLGQRVAIHACKTDGEMWRVKLEPFTRRLRDARTAGKLMLVDGDLPRGAILATAVVRDCTPITPETAARLAVEDPDEHAFGGYDVTAGARYAWTIGDVIRLPAPVPFRGRQGVPDIDPTVLGLPAEPSCDQGRLL
jgi:hypothetical protein